MKHECELEGCDISFELNRSNKKYCCGKHANRAKSKRSYERISSDPVRNQKRKEYIRKYMNNRYQTDAKFRDRCIASITKYKMSPKGKATRKRWLEGRKLDEESSHR